MRIALVSCFTIAFVSSICVAESNFHGGLIVHLGCGDGVETVALHGGKNCVVHGLVGNTKDLKKARAFVQSKGVYGPVSIDLCPDTGRLPYCDGLVNLMVVGDEALANEEEIMRVLAPGGIARIGEKKIVKPWPKDVDEWQQHFRNADNNAVAQDDRVGPPHRYRWIADPEWSRAHLNLPSINSMVSSGGRLFTIEDWASTELPSLPGQFSLIARDAFNGIVLWRRPLPDWQPVNCYVKFTPIQLQRQLAAIGEIVYCTPGLNAPITAFDAKTGAVLKTHEGTSDAQEFVYHDKVLYIVEGDPTDTRYVGRWLSKSHADTAFPQEAYGPVIRNKDGAKSFVKAVDCESGKTLWETGSQIMAGYRGGSMGLSGNKLVFCTKSQLVCLNCRDGKVMWKVPVTTKLSMTPGVGVTLILSADKVFWADLKTVAAHSLKDGKQIWADDLTGAKVSPADGDGVEKTNATRLGHFKAPDLYLAQGVLWSRYNQIKNVGYDPQTGEVVSDLPQTMNKPMGHDRCYRHRVTEKYYINSATGGTDFLRFDGSAEFPNPWVRSTCGIGYLPCNGLLYVGPEACSCNNVVLITAMNALETDPALTKPGEYVNVETRERLEKGPAYGKVTAAKADPPWPTYRGNMARGGSSQQTLSPDLKPQWKTKIKTRASAPVIAEEKVFVADVDAFAVCALSIDDGRELWRYTTGSRVDSAPTYYKGMLLFGSRDGWVYCLRASDGALVWRFKDLPDRLISAFGRLESAWPVSGSVLVQNDMVYFGAGRNSFVDGGIFLYAMEPVTGKVLHRTRLVGPYGSDGFPVMNAKTGAHGIQGAKNDVLSGDGELVYLRHKAFEKNLKEVQDIEIKTPHLIPVPGFLEDEPHHRTFWTIDTTIRYDIPTGSRAVHGDILAMDSEKYYQVIGYKPGRTGPFNPKVSGYNLCAGRIADLGKRPTTTKAGVKKRKGKGAKTTQPKAQARYQWSTGIPVTGKAILLANNTLFIAGTPITFPKDNLSKAYDGRMGGVIWIASAEDGKKLGELKLDAPPSWDSLATADGKLFLCTQDGHVLCFQ
jgi:outer membrane protein assembly factor BamB